jgi:hypothetical protein
VPGSLISDNFSVWGTSRAKLPQIPFQEMRPDQFRLFVVQAFGKRFSNWWLLALVPIALITSPILLMVFSWERLCWCHVWPSCDLEPPVANSTTQRPCR